MLVRLTRLAKGKVIGDLLARTIFPVTEDVREKIRTINQVDQVAENIVTIIGVFKMLKCTSARTFIWDMEFFLSTGRHLSLQNDTEGYISMSRTQSIDKSQDSRSVKDIYLGIQKLKLTSLF